MANYYFVNELHNNRAIIYDDIHHIRKVARHKIGEIIGIIMENEGRGTGKIISITKDKVEIDILSWQKVLKPDKYVSLIIPVINTGQMKEIIKHGTEIGIDTFYVTKFKFSSEIRFNISRWESVIRESCKQSGNPLIPKIKFLESDVLFNKKGFYLCHKSDIVNNIELINGENCIFVGPEGGWSDEEIDRFDSCGFTPLKIGMNILRTETAAIVGSGIIKFFIDRENE